MQTVLQDLRQALRTLLKAPGFTTAAVLTLALGIGTNTAMFSVIEAVILRALLYQNSGHLTLISDAENRESGGFLYKDFAPFKTQSRSFQDLAIYYRDSGYSRATLGSDNEPQQVQGAWVAANLFPLLGVRPQIGRVFTDEEEANRERVVVLSHGLWARRFGSASDVLGKEIAINGSSFQIIGVMPQAFQFPARDQMFWAPITTNPFWGDRSLTANIDPNHSSGFYQRWQVIGRLAQGVTLRQAQAESDTVLERVTKYDPDPFRMHRLQLVRLHVEISGNIRLTLTVLFCAVCCVLFIACTNVANLVLARGAERGREIAIRSALGASRARLVRELLSESLLLASMGALLGVALAFWGVRVLIASAPADIPRLEQAGLNASVLAFTVLILLIATVLFGVGPAVLSSRHAPQEAVSLSVRGTPASPAVSRARKALVISEFAIALLLLTAGGLLLRSLWAVESVDPGFEPRQTLALRMTVPGAPPAKLLTLHDQVLAHLRALPGAEYVGAVNDLFEPPAPNLLGLRAIAGRSVEPKEKWTALVWKSVSGDYFQAIGATLLKGRYFTEQDNTGSPLVTIIDESMARRYWPDQDPLGAQIKGQDQRGRNDEWVTVIGVVRDMRRSGLEHEPTPHVFEWYRQSGVDRTENLVVRAAGDPRVLAGLIRSTVRGEDASAVLSSVNTVEDLLMAQLAPRRFQTWLLGLFSGLALLLAGIGIYGVIHYSVCQRTHEIGVRIALGANPAEVLRLVEGEGLRLAAVGVSLGVISALLVVPVMSSLLFGIHASDPFTFLTVIGILLVVALIACYIPARRAARMNPLEALRYE